MARTIDPREIARSVARHAETAHGDGHAPRRDRKPIGYTSNPGETHRDLEESADEVARRTRYWQRMRKLAAQGPSAKW